MRNLKKFLALVLAMLMVVSAAATVSAFDDVADDHQFAEAINDLTVKEIVNGYDGETFGVDDAVTRQQMAIMMARAITGNVGDDAVWQQGGLVGFNDVTEYQYAIATVVRAGIVNGFLDNSFRPDEGITFVQALKMAVCALGYDDGKLAWWEGYYNVAMDLGLTDGLNYITDPDKALTRGEVAQLIYNMLYIELADGSDCFASANFGLATPDNVTTFVITATDEQTAAEGMDVTEGGYVGLQALVNGVPEGDVFYVPVEMLGFEEDEDEEYFLHAFNVVNWDAENASFDQIIPTGTVEVIYQDAISGKSNASAYNRFKYNGANYYVVDELTGTAIRNEVVLYNATDYGYTTDNKQLFLNKEGQVLDADGDVILEAVYSVTGDIVSYRAIRDDLDGKVTKGDYLSVTKATALYGAEVGYVSVPFATMDVDALTGAYQLTLFDDDMDGEMDRAYYTPVYVSVKEGFESTDKHKTDGPFKGWDDGDKGKITGMEDLSNGDVFVYTFNEQLAEVTVLDILEVEEGTVQKINTTTNKSSNWYSTITLTDGTSLRLYNKGNAAATANASLGANVQASGAIDYDDEDGWMHQITDDLLFELVDDSELLTVLESGDLIRYYARNGIILFAETYDIDDVFERVVLKEVVDADLEALYLDIYRNGEVEEIAVTKIWDDDDNEYVVLEDLTWLQISRILSDLTSDLDEGTVYRISELEGGYQMSEVLDDSTGSTNATSKFKLYEIDLEEVKTNDIKIDNGVFTADSFKKASDSDEVRENRLRTNEDTIWYFITEDSNGKRDVKVFSGELEEATLTINTSKTRIFADKVGYTGSDRKGVASEVYVFDSVKSEGFGWRDDYSSIVFVTNMTKTDTDYYEQGNASDVGLNTKEYTASNYYKYSNSYAIDMYTGAPTTVYSTFLLKNNTAYTINEDGVVLDLKGNNSNNKLKELSIKRSAIEWDDEFISIKKVLHVDAEVDALYARKVDTGDIRKTEKAITDNIFTSDSATYDIIFVGGYEAEDCDEDDDGIFVIIVGEFSTEDDEDEYVGDTAPNATWYNDEKKTYYMGYLDMSSKTTTELSGSVNFANDTKATAKNYKDDIYLGDDNLLEISADKFDVDSIRMSIKKVDATTDVAHSVNGIGGSSTDGFDCEITLDNNTISFTMTAGRKTYTEGSAAFTLGAGTYDVRIVVPTKSGSNERVIEATFKIEA